MKPVAYIRAWALCAALLFLAGSAPGEAPAFFQPDYQNRCTTNFLDAYVPGTGFMFQSFLYHYTSTELRVRSSDSHRKFRLSVTVSLNQFLYISKKKCMGGNIGAEVIVPVIRGHLADGSARSRDSGIGDVFAACFIQGRRRTLTLGGVEIPFCWRVLAGAFLPTGGYDCRKEFNSGCSLVTAHTYLSCTAFLSPRWTASWRIMYNVHTSNARFGRDRISVRPGQLLNIHFSSCYAFHECVRMGFMGHYWRQTTDDRIDGHCARGRELLAAFGPGVICSLAAGGKTVFCECHVLFDSVVRNRARGKTFQIRAGIMF